jgi:hypothetical protein
MYSHREIPVQKGGSIMMLQMQLALLRLQNFMYLLTDAAESDPFSSISQPIIDLIDTALTPALGLVGALGAVYCVILGAKLAQAEEPQDREKAKNALKNALLGFVLIFVLLVVLKLGMKSMTTWYKAQVKPKSS